MTTIMASMPTIRTWPTTSTRPSSNIASAKLGMWVFLGTEILMFGGLFCAYAVYRHNHPDVFAFAHQFLNSWLGAVNTLVLITSSLTMAWAVRCSQLGQQTALRVLLAVTILGGYMFLGIKSIEYNVKWEHTLFIGQHNQFRAGYTGPKYIEQEEQEKRGVPILDPKTAASKPLIEAAAVPGGPGSGPVPVAKDAEPAKPGVICATPPAVVKLADNTSLIPPDPNTGGPDQAKIRPEFTEVQGMAPKEGPKHADELELNDLNQPERERLYTFFGIYFFMTGLHGLHVVIGMSLIAWVLIRSAGPKNIPWVVPMIPASIGLFFVVVGLIIDVNWFMIAGLILAMLSVAWALIWAPMRRNASTDGEFGPTYYTPVDLVGLYWHLVDLIWIFLFPLLYLIH